MGKFPCVYLLANRPNGTLYIGVTSDLPRRLDQHKRHDVPGFTCKYEVLCLVWYEGHSTMESAIRREKALKKWNRAWKIRLIEKHNCTWEDLAEDLG